MRPVRILLSAVALIAVAVTGWALGARHDDTPSGGTPATTAPAPGGITEKVVGVHHADPLAQP